MSFLALQALTGLASASSLFLLSAGLTVIFGVTRVVNFAHGGLFMVGAYIGWTILTHLAAGPLPFVLGGLGAALAVAALGVVMEIAVLRRVYRSPALFQLLATFGVLLVIEELTQRIWGPEDLSLPRPPWLRQIVPIGTSLFPAYDLALIGVGPLVLLLLWALFAHTRWGTLVRAATQDREMVGALGVDQRVLFTTVFALGAGLAGLGGVLTLPDQSANLQMDLEAIIDAFVIVVVGGLGSVPGAYLAAVLIGELQAFGIVLIPRATLVLAFVVMAIVLALRPNGLLGRPLAEGRGAAGLAPLLRPAPGSARLLGAVALTAAVLTPFYLGPYGLSVLTEAMTAILFAASLHLMMGPGGMPSFGHAAFFGLGAYAAALLAQSAGMVPGLALAATIAGVAAAAVGCFAERLAGVYLAMLTLAFAQIVWAAAFQWVALTGGDNGILNVWPAAWASTPAAFFWLSLLLCLGATLLLRRALYAPFGFALRATRDAPCRAEAIGLNAFGLRVGAFALAGAGAGLAGGVFAFAKGALAYTGLYDALLQATDWWRLVLGLAIIALVLAFPEGIAGAALRIMERRRRLT